MRKNAFMLAAIALVVGGATAAELPQAGPHDERVQYVTYSKDDVTVVHTALGTITRIVLGDDEHIVESATGFPADCKDDKLEWCVHADKGENFVWLKPKEGATTNNLELHTDKRDYSFQFPVVPQYQHAKKGEAHVTVPYRVIFRYAAVMPSPDVIAAINQANAAASQAAAEKTLLTQRLASAKPTPRNWNYSRQVLEGAEDIAPSLVFDDGRFTYFQFPANREIPTIYYIDPTGQEARINFHMDGDLAVVQRTGRRFVLRLGKAVVGVWNDSFDATGVAPAGGTTVDGVERVIRTTEVSQ